MKLDVLFDPFGARWHDVLEGARAAEGAGLDGLWLYDHLAGSVHRQSHVLEAWTTLTAIAAHVPRIAIGPMVLNVANRDPGTLAVMAATFQEVSNGRLLLGLGAGGGRETPYAAEQEAFGRPVPGDEARRDAVAATVKLLRWTWSGSVAGVGGFLQPDPAPPVIIGGFGPKMAELAGRVGDGMNIPGGVGTDRLIAIARKAHSDAGNDPDAFIVTASANASAREHDRLRGAGVDRVVMYMRPPYTDGVRQAAALIPR